MSAVYYDLHGKAKTRPKMAKAGDGLKFSNQHRTTVNHYPGEGSAPFSSDQKAKICILAKKAFSKIHGRAPVNGAEVEAWRREEQRRTVGKESLTLCGQEDFLPLLSRFADLAGESGVQLDAEIKVQTGPERVAMFKLKEACTEAGLPLAYPAAICRNQNKCALEKATAKQLWRLVFTVRNRRGGTPKIDRPF